MTHEQLENELTALRDVTLPKLAELAHDVETVGLTRAYFDSRLDQIIAAHQGAAEIPTETLRLLTRELATFVDGHVAGAVAASEARMLALIQRAVNLIDRIVAHA